MPIAVSACLKHQCLLVHRCPQCRRAIWVQDLIKGTCRYCDYPFIDAPVIDLSDDPVGLWTQQVIQSWFGFTERPLANKEIPIEPPSVLYRVADGLRYCLMRLPANTDGVHRLPTLPNPLPCRRKTDLVPSTSYQLYAMAVRAMTNWPHTFYEFVQTYRENQPNWSFHRGLQADFGILYSQWITKQWRDDPYQFIQEAFDQYLIDAEYHHPPATKRSGKANTTDVSDLITLREAMEILRVNETTMNRLIERGVLNHYDTPDRFSFVDAQEVIELRHRWDNAVSLSDCVGLLGTSKEVVKSLIEADYLTSVRGSETDGGFLWLVSKESIESLRQSFAQGFIEGEGEITLAQTVQMLHPLNIGMSQLLIAILEGHHSINPSMSNGTSRL